MGLIALIASLGLPVAAQSAPGDLDPSFSGDGRRRTHFGGNDRANAVAIQPNGRIVAAGSASGGAMGYDFALARYLGN